MLDMWQLCPPRPTCVPALVPAELCRGCGQQPKRTVSFRMYWATSRLTETISKCSLPHSSMESSFWGQWVYGVSLVKLLGWGFRMTGAA